MQDTRETGNQDADVRKTGNQKNDDERPGFTKNSYAGQAGLTR
jgi:hypothetical protein